MPRGLRLSPSGSAFREDVLRLMEALDAACDRAQRVAKSEVGTLRIGYIEVAGWEGIVPDAFRQSAPLVRLDLTPANSPDQLSRMTEGALDGSFVYQFGALPPGLESIPLRQHGVVLAMPTGWKDRPRGVIRLRNLIDTPFVLFHRSAYPAYHDQLLSTCAAGGLFPRIVAEAKNEAAVLSLVSAGIGIAIVNDRNQHRPPPRVEFAEIRDLRMQLPLVFTFPQERRNPALEPMLKYLRGERSKLRNAR